MMLTILFRPYCNEYVKDKEELFKMVDKIKNVDNCKHSNDSFSGHFLLILSLYLILNGFKNYSNLCFKNIIMKMKT